MPNAPTIEVLENPMRRIRVAKVALNIGVGKSGVALENAKKVLQEITGQQPCFRKAKRTIRDFGIHRGEPIACMVTLRGEGAIEVLKRLLATREMKLSASSFDERGNCSFGIKEHIEIQGVRYDPEIGILGMDVSVVLERPGYRIVRRKRGSAKVGRSHIINKEEAVRFFREELGVEVQ